MSVASNSRLDDAVKNSLRLHALWRQGGDDGVRADFSGVDLSGVRFGAADLEGAKFRGATLVGCSFIGASLRNADLFKADLSNADLSYVDLEGADVRAAAWCELSSGSSYESGR